MFKQPFVEYSAPLVNAATPTITAEPQSSSTVNVGGSVSLSVTANAGDGGTLTYQWYSNTANNTSGSIVSGATSATYTPPTTTAGTLYYYVVVTNTNNSVNGTKTATTTSSVAEVTVNAIVNAVTPTITAHPQGSSTVNVGGSVSLSVTANAGDGGTLTYQWYSNTANNTSGSIVSGATSATYSAPTATAGTLYYYVVVTNTNNGVNGTKTATQTSSVATVTVNVVVVPPPPSNDANLQDLTVSKSTLSPAFDADSTHYTLLLPCDDSTVTINAVAPLGGGTVSYTVDGQAATKDVVARNIGTTAVRVRSTAAAGTTHKDYTVDVIRPFPKSIIVQYWNDILAVDQSQTKFTHFQWKDAGGEPVGKDRPYLSLVTDNVPPTGTYNVEVTTSNGQKTPVCVGVQTKPWAVTSSLTVYPNPVSGTMTVKNPDYESVHIIELFDLNGQLVGQYSSSEATSNIDVSGLSSGLYVLRAGRQTQKIIIE
ncbi:hypothetical protein FACS1894199_17840 [Bacteroidia bacterium]|nr:hypothetical protein FACS1894199_17840 [Bacteroidia bacterium]